MLRRPSILVTERWFTRRESLQLLGLGAMATVVTPRAKANDVCLLTPELTVGPYYVQDERVRQDITENKPGIPLLLRVTVLDSMKCTPIRNAAVDIWHCDAMGYYSGYTAVSPDGPIGGPGGGPRDGGPGPGGAGMGDPGRRGGGPPPEGDVEPNFAPPTDTLTYFRGLQFTDARGVAEFKTIYPGWYFGRATHIHMKVHVDGQAKDERYAGGHVCHVGQLAFPEDISDRVGGLPPYSAHGTARTRIAEDSVFTEENAAQGMVKLSQVSRGDASRGFVGNVAITVDPKITPKHAPMNGAGFQRQGQNT